MTDFTSTQVLCGVRDCTASGPGSLPAPALTGHAVCGLCLLDAQRGLRTLASVWEDLATALTARPPSDGVEPGDRPSTGDVLAIGLDLNAYATELRHSIAQMARAFLHQLGNRSVYLEYRQVPGALRTFFKMADRLFLATDEATQIANIEDVLHHVQRAEWALEGGARPVHGGPCPKPNCDGDLFGRVRPGGEMGKLRCRKCRHELSAADAVLAATKTKEVAA